MVHNMLLIDKLIQIPIVSPLKSLKPILKPSFPLVLQHVHLAQIQAAIARTVHGVGIGSAVQQELHDGYSVGASTFCWLV